MAAMWAQLDPEFTPVFDFKCHDHIEDVGIFFFEGVSIFKMFLSMTEIYEKVIRVTMSPEVFT